MAIFKQTRPIQRYGGSRLITIPAFWLNSDDDKLIVEITEHKGETILVLRKLPKKKR